MKKQEIKTILINWLCDEYEKDHATRQIKDAEIIKNKDKITIKYKTGAIDIVEIKNGNIKHLNPNKY